MNRQPKVGRNDLCPCGSGKKFKQCCEGKTGQMSRGARIMLLALAGLVVTGLALAVNSATSDEATSSRRVWSPEHGHYHDVP